MADETIDINVPVPGEEAVEVKRDMPGMDQVAEMCSMLAIMPDHKPDWIRESGIDEAEILVFGEWENSPQKVTIQGPTRGTLKAFLEASRAKKDTDEMVVRLVREVVIEMPESLKARRPFALNGAVWIAKGAPYPTPEDLAQGKPEALKDADADKAVREYILNYLPHRMVVQICSAAMALGTPDLSQAFSLAKKAGPDGDDPLSRASAGTSEAVD